MKKIKKENKFNPKIQIARRFLLSQTIHCFSSRIRAIMAVTWALLRRKGRFWMKMRPKSWVISKNCWKMSMEKNLLKIRNSLMVPHQRQKINYQQTTRRKISARNHLLRILSMRISYMKAFLKNSTLQA